MESNLLFSSIVPALCPQSLQSIESFGFKQMTPVQRATIPLFMSNKDVCVEATTGSGKTLAFVIPVCEILNKRSTPLKKHEVGAMVVGPTRELAMQIYSVFSDFIKPFVNLRCALLVGGTAVADNEADFMDHGAQIVVGTPGRIIDIIHRCQAFNLRELEILVLDEADTLLDMGFRQEVSTILSLVPKQRRTGLFSATQTKEVKELARAGMRNPVTVAVTVQSQGSRPATHQQQVTPSTLENYFTICKYDDRPGLLVKFLSEHKDDKIIVFVATCACVDYYSECFLQMARRRLLEGTETAENFHPILLPDDLNVYGLHGKMVPKKRNGIYRKFVDKPSGVLFCTDVAARGIDIPDVDWIVQMAAPKDPAFFVHRVGRTARAGRRGGALIFVTEEEIAYIELLRGRGIPLVNRDVQLGANDDQDVCQHTLKLMKAVNAKDRELLEGSSTAFMSFLRAYKEHQCSFIFRMDSLDIGGVARSYGLLRLPKIPETKNRAKIKFQESLDIDTSAVSYHHAEKEAARQRRLVTSLEERRLATLAAENAPKKRRVEVIEENPLEPEKRKRKKKQSYEQKRKEAWDDMAAETALYNKFKKGKISKEEYEEQLCSASAPASDDDDSDSEDDVRKKGRSRPISANGNVDYRKKRSNKPLSSMKGLRKKKT